MATYKDWPDGKAHSIPYAEYRRQKGTVAIGNTPVTQDQYKSGGLLSALTSPEYAAAAGFPQATAPVVDPRIDAWYNGQLGGLGQARNNVFDQSTYDVGHGAIDTGFKYGTTHNTGNEGDNTAEHPHTFNYDTYSFDPTAYQTNGVADIDKASYDPSNPFTKMGMLQQSYEGAKRGTTNSYAAQGQLYSGAIGNQRVDDHTNASGAFNTLANSFLDIVNGGNRNNTTAIGNYNTGATGAAGQKLAMKTGGYTG